MGATDPAPSPPEQRVLTALYTALGVCFMALIVWHQLDPEGPTEWFGRARARLLAWRDSRVELIETLEEIRGLPEANER